MGMPLLIAEVKTQSPFGFQSKHSAELLFALAEAQGHMIAIHTHLAWRGSYSAVSNARQYTSKDILAKGIHGSDDEVRCALVAGADKVLVVGRMPAVDLLPHCYLEPLSLADLATYPLDTRVVWNQRDLATGMPKRETFAEARALWKGWLCQASYLRTMSDVHPGADAVLVGEHLPTFIQSYLSAVS